MTDIDFALRDVPAAYDCLRWVDSPLIERLREAHRLRHLDGSNLDPRRAVIKEAHRRYADLLHDAIDELNRPAKDCFRRSSPVEQLKGLTRGFEYAGQVSGGNFAVSF
jgi:hypothetical protein